jgi:hypothetical protein
MVGGYLWGISDFGLWISDFNIKAESQLHLNPKSGDADCRLAATRRLCGAERARNSGLGFSERRP